MIEQIRLALMRFGITSFTKEKKVNGTSYYSSFIYGDNLNNFAKEIGFYHPKKSERLQSLLEMDFIDNTNVLSSSRVDCFDEIICCNNFVLIGVKSI